MRPFGVALGLGVIVWAFRRRVERRVRIYVLWFLFISVLISVVPLRYGDFSFWTLLFGWLPGLSPIRDRRRVIHLYQLSVVLVAAFVSRSLPRRSPPRLAIAAMVLALLIGTSGTSGTSAWDTPTFHFERPRSVFNEWVLGRMRSTPSCSSFFIKGASARYMSRSGHMWGLYAMDSMFIAWPIPFRR